MRRELLYFLCGVIGWAALWPLVLGVSALHSGLGVASYGPWLALSAAMYVLPIFLVAKLKLK